MAFATLGTIQLFHAYNVKHVFDSLFSTKPFNNKYLNGASLLSAALLYGVILIPGINDFFDVTLPTTEGWLIIIGASLSIIVFVEIIKWILIVFVEIIKWIFRKTGFADKYKKNA